MNDKIQRVFLVGAPRSGTTLLQSLLASHSQIVTLPETKFFNFIGNGQRRFCRLGIANKKQQNVYHNFCGMLPSMPFLLPKNPYFVFAYAKLFLRAMDSLAMQQNRSVWLEKTPSHALNVRNIEKYIPGVKFVHNVRNGRDNIASIYDACLKYPETFGDADIPLIFEWWKKHIIASIRYSGKPNHLIVGYPQVVNDTKLTLQKVCDFIGIPFEEEMLDRDNNTISKLIIQEKWKDEVHSPIESRDNRKFCTLFTEEEQEWILERLSQIDLSSLPV